MAKTLRISRSFNFETEWYQDVKSSIEGKLSYWDVEFFSNSSLTVMGKDEFYGYVKKHNLRDDEVDIIKENLVYSLSRYSRPTASPIADRVYLRKNSHNGGERSNIAVKFHGDPSLINDRIVVTQTVDSAIGLSNQWPPNYIFNLSICRVEGLLDEHQTNRIAQRLASIVLPKSGVRFEAIMIEPITLLGRKQST